ncbi:MAG: hypothetical protein II208_02465, partial [Alphaproteobacteria bacterium]|nr:hypothetical protein [Alphaproteobacteria bacterium]
MKIARIVMPFTALTIMAAPCYATDTLTSFEALKAALSEMDANVVLDMSTTTSEVSANIGIAASQSVVLKNITSWTNPAAAIDIVTPRMIINNGTLALDNVGILNNTLFVSSGEVGGGASILNKGKILEISNSRFNDNFVGSIPKNDLWGGLISNLGAGEIATIKDTVFTGNRFETAQSAPHGAIIYNASKIGRIENVDFIDNVMTAQANFKGGGHGTTIDNNQYSEIGVITNTRFIDNKTYKPGTNAPEGHASGGALDNYNIIGEISNSLFQGNVAETESKNAPAMGGGIKNSFATNNGAIGLINLIKNVDFIENRAVNSNGVAYGGAYSTSYSASNAATTVKSMQDVMFRGNYASGNWDTDNVVAGLGGAIYSYGIIGELSGEFIDNYAENKHGKSWAQGGAIHNGSAVANINNMTATFNGNYANAKQGTAQGGAIWNMGTISMTDSTFLNNAVIGSQDTLTGGGAIWNSGTITMRGQNNFMDNKTQIGTSVYDNDIFNSGTINVTQDATLNINGGMTGNDGTINIAQNAT